jgi:hypothetical protein
MWSKKSGRASIGVITIKKGIPNLLRQPARSIVTTELTSGKKARPAARRRRYRVCGQKLFASVEELLYLISPYCE